MIGRSRAACSRRTSVASAAAMGNRRSGFPVTGFTRNHRPARCGSGVDKSVNPGCGSVDGRRHRGGRRGKTVDNPKNPVDNPVTSKIALDQGFCGHHHGVRSGERTLERRDDIEPSGSAEFGRDGGSGAGTRDIFIEPHGWRAGRPGRRSVGARAGNCDGVGSNRGGGEPSSTRACCGHRVTGVGGEVTVVVPLRRRGRRESWCEAHGPWSPQLTVVRGFRSAPRPRIRATGSA